MSDPLLQSRIYIVDDDVSNRDVLEANLAFAGFTNITMAGNGVDALALVEQQLPDLILLDIMMPEMDGFQVIQHIRATYPDQFIPIVLLSALNRPEDRVKGIRVGANDFLNKPYDGDELIARVFSLLSYKQTVDALRAEQARSLALLNQISNPVIVTDAEGIITQVNPAVREHLALGDEVLDRTLESVFGLALEDLLIRARERQGAVSGIFTPRGGNVEQPVTFNVSVSPITEVGYILFWQDVTALQEGEQARLNQAHAETKHVLDTFSHYMSPTLVERVLDDPTITARRERRDAAVLFADLRGFTRLTLLHSPHDVMALLNDIFTDMIDVVNAHDGLLFDITGDELLIAFNVPYDQDNPLQRALDTAIEMHRTFQGRRARRERRGMEVGMGIGVNYGPVVLGHVGGHSQMSYTMIGQAINVAHRMVEVAEDRQIVIFTELLADWKPNGNDLRRFEMAPMQVKNIPEPVMLSAIELVVTDDKP
ncbi:MAG: response regulator [Anaerolineae bacterium]|nr:response regulator [Anaerolineae bacterium]